MPSGDLSPALLCAWDPVIPPLGSGTAVHRRFLHDSKVSRSGCVGCSSVMTLKRREGGGERLDNTENPLLQLFMLPGCSPATQ